MNITFFRRFGLYLVVVLVLSNLPSCLDVVQGWGDLKTETRNHINFHALDVSIPGDVEVRVSDKFSVEVTCEENIIDDVQTRVDDGVLKIFFDRNVFDVDGMVVRVSAPRWDNFEINGSGDVRILDAIEGDNTNIELFGSGNLDARKATFKKADVLVAGSGNVTLRGKADQLNAKVRGSGDIRAFDFPANTTRAEVSGSGNISIEVFDYLDAIINGSGDIRYRGNPKVDKKINGSGSVRKV
jgi:Putative auto-transporter adhesin, head GIN domain